MCGENNLSFILRQMNDIYSSVFGANISSGSWNLFENISYKSEISQWRDSVLKDWKNRMYKKERRQCARLSFFFIIWI